MIDQQELFNHMAEQHNLTLLEGEMNEIIHLVIQGLNKSEKTYPEPISGVVIGETSTMILGHEYKVVGADWFAQELVLKPVNQK